MSHLEVLRAELERLFDLDELLHLSQTALGFDPEQVGGQATLGSFAGALVNHCVSADAVFALVDALRATGKDLHPAIVALVSGEPDKDSSLAAGAVLGTFQIARKLGDGRLGSTYLARSPTGDVRLKVLHPETTRDLRGLQRFLTLTRLLGRIESDSYPKLEFAGLVGGRYVVAHKYLEGQPLAVRVGRTGPMHINEARSILKEVASALDRMHSSVMVHGALSLDNVIAQRSPSGEPSVVLLDAGTHFLRTRQGRTRNGLNSTGGNPKTVSPEQIRGAEPSPQSDAYSLGALMYELLTGKPPFEGDVLDVAFGHLTKTPAAPSTLAPRGWGNPELDQLVLGLLSKDPRERTPLSAVVERLEDLSRGKRTDDLTAAQIQELEQKLLSDATNHDTAAALEAAVGRGATAEQVGQALRLAASMLDEPEDLEDKKRLLARAARLFEAKADTLEKAEATYTELCELDANNPVSFAGLEEVLGRQGKYEALLEFLLGRAEAASSPSERARAMAKIGRTYLRSMDDPEQAVVAFSQAFCDSPSDELAAEIDRACGTNETLWAEALQAIAEASQDTSLAPEQRTALLLRAGEWYRSKVSRADLALPCFQAVLAVEPSSEVALVGLTDIYRKAQQWQELGMILTHRADAAPTPQAARDLRAEAAEVLEQKMGDAASARTLFEAVLAEDPGHPKANEALGRILDASRDYPALVSLLERRLAAESAADKLRTVCRIGEIYEDRLGQSEAALGQFEKALAIDSQNLDALRGIERVLTKQGRFRELLENLERQVAVSATPKQRVLLLERIASVYEEEFLDQAAAATALERALAADPGRISAMQALVRHLRVLGRWEDVSRIYQRQLEIIENKAERIPVALVWGRLLADQIGSPERAVHAYEMVLDADPQHAGALEALAKLRELIGDAGRALEAILSLADKAESPAARAEQYLRAARLLESKGDRDGAIEHYRTALECLPDDRNIAASLRAAYVARGDTLAALDLLEREIDATEGDRAQAKLAGEMARICYDKLKDERRAEASAQRALRLDPSNFDGLVVLGNLCFDQKRYVEASAHLGRIADRAESLERPLAIKVLTSYIDALGRSGSTAGALAAAETLSRLAPDDAAAIGRVASVTFAHGSPAQAVSFLQDYLARFGASLNERDKALATYQLGEATRKNGAPGAAIALLEESVELDPSEAAPLVALSEAHLELGNYVEAISAKARQLDVATTDERVQLLIEIGEIAAGKLGDRNYAARSFVAALEERPDDRRILSRLMQLYSEEKDWQKLVDVVAKLADFVEDPAQKVKYLHTAALVSGRELGDSKMAADYFKQVLELEPTNERALKELIDIQTGAKQFASVEQLLQRQIALATQKSDNKTLITAYDALGELYRKNMVDPERAATALEAAFELDRDNPERLERLSQIYLADPDNFREKGIFLHEFQLSKNPYRHESYKALRKIYTVARNADASWALCQVLKVLGLAEADEERFYARMRAETAAPAQQVFDEATWGRLMHPTLDPLLTMTFALIEPAVVRARSQSLEAMGLAEHYRVDPSQYDAPVPQTLYYAAGVLGVNLPAVYINPNDQGGLSYLYTVDPSLSLGRMAQSSQVPPQVAAFVAAKQLSYLRPGLYLRHFIQTGTALKAWLFAAIKLSSPQFPVAPDIEGAVLEDLAALRQYLTADAKDHLASTVSKLIQSGTSLDLKKWANAADLTSDRIGFVVAHDLDTAVQVIRADTASTIPSEERLKELIAFAASHHYFDTRRYLGVTVDS